MARLRLQPRTGSNSRPDAMQKKRRNGRASTKTSVEDEIAHLRGLDLGGLRARWHGVFLTAFSGRLRNDHPGYTAGQMTRPWDRHRTDFAKLVELFDAHGV